MTGLEGMLVSNKHIQNCPFKKNGAWNRDGAEASVTGPSFCQCRGALRACSWNATGLRCHVIKITATATDSKEGDQRNTLWTKNVCPSSSNDYLLQKNFSYEKGTALKLCRRILGMYSHCPSQKSILHRIHSEISSAKTFVHFFGDFSPKTLQLEMLIKDFSFSLILVRHLFKNNVKKRLRHTRSEYTKHSDENPKTTQLPKNIQLKITHRIVL